MPKSLTIDRIKEIIKEEKASLKAAGVISHDTVEGAWSGGDNLVNKIDYVKKLGIKEQKYRKKADVYRKLREKLQESIKRSK